MDLTDRLKSFAKEQLIMLISLVLIFGALSVLSVFFFASERKNSLLFVEFRAEESAFALLDYYTQGLTPDSDELEQIVGFAIYNTEGSAVVSGGRYPRQLDTADITKRGSTITIDWKSRTASIAKPLGMLPQFMTPPSGGARRGGMSHRPPNTAIYVEIYVPEMLSPYRWYGFAQIIAPSVLIAGFILVGFILLKNWEYRKEIDSQRHLVHLGEAARTLSHEIKNPLTAIQIQAAILRKTLPDESLESTRIIDEEVQRLRVLTERVGEFLKNPKGNPELFDADEFVRELLDKLPWRVEYQGSENITASICADRQRFRSVIENLVRNAAESGPETIPISVSVTVERNFVVITVEDEGTGISAEDRERVFEPFFTTKDTGSGIGLAISRRFVEVADGSISLEPGPRGGTRALVKLPRCTQ